MTALAGHRVRIVPTVDADLATLSGVINDAFFTHELMRGERTSPEGLVEEAGPAGQFIVLEDGGEVFACAMIRPVSPEYDGFDGYRPTAHGPLLWPRRSSPRADGHRPRPRARNRRGSGSPPPRLHPRRPQHAHRVRSCRLLRTARLQTRRRRAVRSRPLGPSRATHARPLRKVDRAHNPRGLDS